MTKEPEEIYDKALEIRNKRKAEEDKAWIRDTVKDMITGTQEDIQSGDIEEAISEIDDKEASVRVGRKDLGSEVMTNSDKADLDRKEQRGKIMKTVAKAAAAVLISGTLLWGTAGRWIAYNTKYANAVNAVELTQGENVMRAKFFDYFTTNSHGNYNTNRAIALTNDYFLAVKREGLTNEEAMGLLRNMSSMIGERDKIRLLPKYLKTFKESGISIEEGIYWIREAHRLGKSEDIEDVIKLMKTMKKEKIILR